MLLSFTIDPNTLSLFLWQSETEKDRHRVRGGRREQQENEVETHRQTNIHI